MGNKFKEFFISKRETFNALTFSVMCHEIVKTDANLMNLFVELSISQLKDLISSSSTYLLQRDYFFLLTS